jgi:hypothetical protein
MSDEVVAGPIADAIKKKIADLIENPQQLIALIQLLKTLFASKDQNLFSAGDADLAELESLVMQSGDS